MKKIDCHNHIGVEMLFYFGGHFPYAQSAVTLYDEGRLHGIDAFIAFPFVTNLSHSIPALREGKIDPAGALESVPYAFENRRLLQEVHQLFPEVGKSMIPFMILDPARECQAQVEALRALAEEFPFYGLKIQSTIIQSDITALLREGRVFIDFAIEKNLPFIIHSSIHPNDCWAQASAILSVAEAVPEVRFCLAHSCRFDKPSLDRVAELDNTWFDCSAHAIHCDLATQDSPVVAVPGRRIQSNFSDPGQVLLDMAKAYPGKLLWGSDSPFYSYVDKNLALVSSYRRETACFAPLSEQQLEAITWSNTLNFLDLPKAKLQQLNELKPVKES